MEPTIALLRGINLGANHRVSMANLRDLFEASGCRGVRTYIQSGNVVFIAPNGSVRTLTTALEAAIREMTGFAVPVILRARSDLAAVVDHNPFPGVEPTKLMVCFLAEAPPATALDTVDVAALAPEEFVVRGREIYMHLPDGMARAKLPGALPVVKGQATVRNWRTVTKVLELADQSSATDLPT